MSLLYSVKRQRPTLSDVDRSGRAAEAIVEVIPAPLAWLEALAEGDATFTARFGAAVAPGWVGFPEALPHTVEAARLRPEDPWGTHLLLDPRDGTLVGFGGFKGAPQDGEVELGYAVAPSWQGRGIATAAVGILVERARDAGVRVVSAHTLAEEGPSPAVLRRAGFTVVAELEDDSATVWRWERPLT